MIWVFALGLLLIALALPVPGDWLWLNRPGLRWRLSKAGLALCCVALVFGEFNARAAVFITVFVVVSIVVAELLYWLEGGRFTPQRIRAGFRWFFFASGPGDPPVRGGFLGMGVVTLVLVAMLLVVRPVVRMAVGLDDGAGDDPSTVQAIIRGGASA